MMEWRAHIVRLVLTGSTLLAGVPFAQAQYAVHTRGTPHMGGGFIELLMTGRTPPPRALAHAGRGLVQYDLPDDPFADPVPQTRVRPTTVAPPPVSPGFDPIYEKQLISYSGGHPAGTIVIDTPNRFLYLVQGGGKALRYGIGVGRPGFEWAGVKHVSLKREWPDWRPPAEMLKRRPDLPRYMAGGPENPLGARALYLGSSLYRIHGTNEPETIGRAVSSGCIRMRNQDVVDLYERVRVGARVIVI